MLTLALSPELEQALAEQARAQNTTPELLAIDSLQERFAPSAPSAENSETQDLETRNDYWAGLIGVIDSCAAFPDGSDLSEDTGKKFAEGMVKKRDQGKL